ncbi:MAG: ABC transporter ATP-binding protein [candidate division NC10 bacterium]|nr:ABC transporter ATP-binding protein [candidate division NC10 bacterium]
MALEVRNLEAGYDGLQVLFGVSLTAHRGEVVAVVGPNGSGKSTLLKAIQGLLTPRGGEIWFLGERIDGLPAHAVVERGVTYIPENRLLFPDMTVRENLEVGGYSRRARPHAAASLEVVCGLFPVLRARASAWADSLSGGEQQMLAVGRGLMARPSLLLLDDPFLGLAPAVTAGFCGTLREVAEEGLTILLVGQHVRRILKMAGRAYLLDAGRIVEEGPGPVLLQAPGVRKALLGA